MPNDEIKVETDGNPETVYEDTAPHERLGFREEVTDQIRYDDLNDFVDGIDV
ncbi:hypothetical protein ACHHV8_25940 [Paenibacillus sp. TAB 01]|uniref:hypothetical protein n=1 Tax=Paenibacillus sp. TAB 01 TaxID=3368988 RepID=UPI00375209C1